ncbi:histone deacetylase [Candidatus Poribacteria bacterium]|nr:histone deacetylase [Candidatus Poribacteria bacterium]
MTNARPAFICSPEYEMDIGRHVFPTVKFRMVRDALVAQGIAAEGEIEDCAPATDEELLAVLHREYLADLQSYRHTPRTIRSELPISAEIVRGCVRCAGGSILAARRAFERGAACHIGGGFHHGFAGHAEGFCYINDVAVAAAAARRSGLCRRVAIIDTDVHQGNGTAHIFRNEPDVFTFSIHQEELYPVKERSDLDIGLPAHAGDRTYCDHLRGAVSGIREDFSPQLVIYVAGADPYEGDQLGSLGLTFAGMEERDRIVIEPFIAAGVPLVTVTAGGYAHDVRDTVALHVLTIRIVADALAGRKPAA